MLVVSVMIKNAYSLFTRAVQEQQLSASHHIFFTDFKGQMK